MGKRKKNNELDAILEQLKRSYGSELDSVRDYDVDQSDLSEEDIELNSVLEKMFSETDTTSLPNCANEESVFTSIIEGSDNSEENGNIDQSLEETIVAYESESEQTESSLECYDESKDNIDEQNVDDVLQLMLHPNHSIKNDDNAGSNNAIIESDKTLTVSNIITGLSTVNDQPQDTIDDVAIEAIEVDSEEQNTVEILPQEVSPEGEAYAEHITDDMITEMESAQEKSDEKHSETAEAIEEEILEKLTPRMITSLEEYVYDPLQHTLSDMQLLKQYEDLFYEEESYRDAKSSSNSDHVINSNYDEKLDTGDVSLLLKFGYEEKVRSQIGYEETYKIACEKDGAFIPEYHKVPYGFCGKELCDKKDITDIQKKYKSEKGLLLFKTIVLAIISIVTLIFDISFTVSQNRTGYAAILILEILLIGVTALILWKKLLYGAIAIAKFEATIYTPIVLVIFGLCLHNIIVAIAYVVDQSAFDGMPLMLYGACAILYCLFATISDLMDCSKEFNTFNILASHEYIYTVEQYQADKDDDKSIHHSSESLDLKHEKTYKVKKAPLIRGYFKKISSSYDNRVNVIYVFGIVPVLAALSGCLHLVVSKNILGAVSVMLGTMLLCMPFACIFTFSLDDYVLSSRLKERKAAFIGTDAVTEYACADVLMFTDNDALEITSYTEINPNKNADSQHFLDMAYRVFQTLGGPLSKVTSNKVRDQDIIPNDIVINSISDNGIDMYFDSSVNILLGDRQYMLSHNIKVKTDANLLAATRGAERSVIYMAFDGTPQLGFILGTKIKSSFLDVADALDIKNIRVFVQSYEPQVNDIYFEQNKRDTTPMISVYKSDVYDAPKSESSCDGGVIAADETSLAQAISMSGDIVSQKKLNKRIHFALILAGFIASCIFSCVIGLRDTISFVPVFNKYLPIVFGIVMILGLIPNISNIFKRYKKKRD